MSVAGTMDLGSLLAELKRRDIRLWREGDALRFDAPEGGFPAELKALVKVHRAEILEHLAAELPAPPDPIPVRGETEGRLSFAQERLWFLQQLDPGDPAYHIPVALRLDGALDPVALNSAISVVTARHGILRTEYFADPDGVPRQRMLPARPVTLPVLDLSALPPTLRDREAERVATATVREPFSLGRTSSSGASGSGAPGSGAPIRWRLVRLAADRHRLILVLHHLSGDGWSLGLLLQQVAVAYASQRTRQAFGTSVGGARDSAPQGPSYLDVAAWQRQRWEDGDLDADVAFWHSTLEGLPDLELPLPEVDGGQPSGRLRLSWFEDRAAGVEALARRVEATPFAVVVAAWQAVLGRITGQQDFALGTPVAGRTQLELEGIVGLLINSLVLRAQLAAAPEGHSPGLAELASRVHRASIAAQEHQELPFERLVSSLEAERGSRRTPLFQVLVAQQPPMPPIRLPRLEMTPLPLWSGAAQMDLLLAFGRTREGFEGYLEYRGERVDPTAAGRWLRSLGTLVQAGLEAPERGWQDLPLLAPAELHQLTVEAGALATPPRALEESDSLWRRFALRCAAAPEAIAVSWEGTTLTYGQLQRRSLRLAARLRGAGVARGDRVGLLLDRSPAMVASILATVAVGAAYVPMDPAYPATRLEFLVQDARPAVLVTEATASSSDLPTAAREVPRLAVAVGGQSVEDSAGGPPQHLEAELPLTAAGKVGADDLAYLIYTSGSTGRPKGVAVAHGQVLRLFDASLDERAFGPSGLGAADVWSVFHSFSFDFSVWEMWGALLLGGRMVLVPRAAARSPQRFLELLEREGVTVLSQTPSAFRSLQGFLESSSEVGVSALPDLAWVVFGGEALDPRALRPWVSRHGVQRPALINMYGITETTVHVTFHRLGAADLEEGRSLVGRPLADLTVFLLDPRQRPLPLGATGEICVGGSGVTRGYFGRPGLTAERFVPDPFSGIPGARLYRSGDLARRRRDGVLETLGRADEQVKIRGHRIEPGEVEAALLALPEIAQTAVIAAPTEGGESRLVAYYVAAATEEPSAEDLLAQLAVDLPPFMVPSLLIALEELPLTAHGKLDRRALPAPSADQVERRAFRPPQSVTERRLAEIWNQVLGVESIGLDDSFFALGGDSILTLRVQALAQRQGLVLNLEDVFRYPTLGEIAAALDLREAEGQVNGGDESVGGDAGAPRPFALLDAAESESIHALHGGRIEDAYAATRLQQGMLFHGELDPTQGIYHDVFSHHLAGPWSLAALEAAAQELARRHPALRTAFELAALRRPLALVSRRAEVGITVVDLRRLDGETQESVIRARLEGEQQRPFVVDRGPLWRLDVAHRGEHRWQLTLSFHHAILDGWSVASLSRELMELYLASLDDSSFPELPPDDSPRRYAAAEVAALENPEVAEHWRRYLASAPLSPMSLPLPLPLAAAEVDRVDEESVPGMAEIPVVVEAQAGSQLQAAAQRLGLPLKSLLLAIHLRVLETATGRRQPWTGLIVHARPGGPAAERSLGLFLNTLPLRSSGPRGDWVSRAQAAFAAEAELQPFRRYPLAEMRQQAGGGELFDTAFNYVHFHIFEGLAQGNRLQVLGGQFLERTDLPLLAHFYRTPEGEGLALTLKADLSRVPQPRLEEIAELYRRAVADAASALGEAPSLEKASSAKKRSEPAAVATLLTVDELRQRLEPGIGAPAAAAPCVDELVAAAVEKSPQAPAVEGPEGELSYRELWWRSGAVARRLRDLGVGPEVPVGLYLGRTAEALVTLLGVLRCGGVALPLDPALPQRRLAAMVRDSGTLVVVADRPPEGILEPETMALSIEEFRGEAPPSDPFADEAPERDPRNPVYLLYTSGSTGKPKAVTLSHGVLAGLLRWQRGSLGDSARTAWFSALGFDVSFEEIFSTWERGGTLVLVGEEERQDPRALLHHLAKYRVERLFLPYVALRELAVAAEGLPAQELPGSLVDLVSAGEQVYVDPAVVALCSGTPPRRLHNHYGPTESHVVSAAQFTGDPARWPPRAPVGGPIAGSRLVVLDEHLEPVAPGAVGELYIGGDVLARCYHRRPGLTAERFLPDPFAGHWGMPVGSRLYRTGDRARWLPVDQLKGQSPQGQQGEGQQLAGYQLAVYQLHILGRLDDQLKVRGHRVESGEVERTLAAHPAVSAAAIAIHGSGSVARLVAYVVLRAEAQASPRQELSPWLAERLPAAMVPDSWVILDALPRTASGKLNRRALPAPAAPSEGEPRVEGRAASGLAVAVAAIFAEVLEVPAVSVDASFFEIGGHSLSAARALARLRRRFDAELPLRLLFEHPSAADLARQLARRQPAAGPLLVRREGEELPPLSFPQERLWLLQQLEPASAAYNLPVPLLLAADAQLGTWRRALENLVARHQTLRSLVVEGPEGARARILPPGTLSLPVVDLWSVPTESRQEVAAGIGRRLASLPFDLAAEPALRATWLDLGELGKALVLVFHHAACDGWSLGVVARELSTEVVGDAAAPPELEIEYGDYAAWQREREAAGALEVSLDWWRQQLAGVPPVLTLPLDRPRSGAGRGAGSAADWVPLSLEIETGASIEALARQQGTTRFAVLLAAYQLLLGRFGGDRRVVVGTPEAGRSLPELEPLVGCFVNTLALSADLGTGGFGDLVNQVGKTVVDALCNAEVPFERLVAELVADRHRDHSPLVQVSFTLDPPGIGGQGEGLFELLSAGAVSARFDLELSLSKAQDGSLFGGLAYRCDLLDRATAERLGASFTRLLGAALGAPKRGLWELELLSPVEQEELIAASVTASPADSCWSLGGRMESTWATHGSQDALLWSGGRWSHQRLGAEVRARVDELHRRGVGPETVVGLDLPRSPELMAWMLAVVAAGGAYLPLTPEHPRPRRAALLADAGACWLVAKAEAWQEG
ncbi:MAG: amino acid adenylation domain-containing protein [Acidobacteriota bacterium]